MAAGVYHIWNQITNDRFIGASNDANGTLDWYIKNLKSRNPVKLGGLDLKIYNNLAKDWQEYGDRSFKWGILEETPHRRGLIEERKLFWCRTLLPSYNMAQYLPLACGIYQVLNKKTWECYIGQSNDIWSRWRQHRAALNTSKHHSLKLQESWKQWGGECFEFRIIEECLPEKQILLNLEQYWISKFNPKFNIRV